MSLKTEPTLTHVAKRSHRALSIHPLYSFRKFWLEIKWNGPFQLDPTAIVRTAFDLSAYFGRSDRNEPFHLTKLLSPVPLFVKNNNQTRGGLGLVGISGM